MREIKFRGLGANGEMVYGLPYTDAEGSTLYYAKYNNRLCWRDEKGRHCNQPYKNGTLGQFIGLHDKNGTEIYEGDIAKVESRSYGVYLSVVQYREHQAGFVLSSGLGKNKQLEMPDKEWKHKHDPCNCDGAMYEGWWIFRVDLGHPRPPAPVEIVGNIHQHPELLEVDDDN